MKQQAPDRSTPNNDVPPQSERRNRQSSEALFLADGSHAVMHDNGLEIRDRRGRLLVRYADGAATIEVPEGDLTLAAPNGRVEIRSAEDIVFTAERDVRQHAGRQVALSAGRPDREPELRVAPESLEIQAKHARIAADHHEVIADRTEIVARALSTSAEEIIETADRVERTAHRLIERARDAFRDVAELCQSRVGRMRTVVRDAYSLSSQRTTMTSKDDTSIDGKRILLG